MMKLKWLLPLVPCCLPPCAQGTDGAYGITVLPDIQYYYNNYQPGAYAKLLAQMRWIVEHREPADLRMVWQLGDITENDNNDPQWTGARGAFDTLDGVVPYVLAVGNHDGVDNGRDSYFTKPQYFGAGSPYATQPTVGGSMIPGDLANSFHFIDTGDHRWLVITLEWAPRNAVLDWLDGVLTAHPDDRAVILTHAYFHHDNGRLDATLLGDAMQGGDPHGYPIVDSDPEGCNDGQEIWRKVLKKHPNVALVYSGHVGSSGVGRRLSIGEARQVVRERLLNFQGWTGNGNGWMQTLRLSDGGDLAEAASFSPFTGESSDDPDLAYAFPLFEAPLPAGQAAALAELEPAYHFSLVNWSAMRPIRNRTAHKDGRALLASKAAGLAHVFAPGDTVSGTLATPSQAWALALWMKFDTAALEKAAPVPAARFGSLAVVAEPADDGMRLALADESGQLVEDHAPLQRDRWYFVAISRGGDGLTFYLDGELLGRSPVLDPPEPTTRLTLGSAAFAGQVHDASVFNRDLSMRELQRLRLSSFTTVQAGQLSTSAAGDGDAEALPGIGRNRDGTGRLNLRRTERSYIRYGSDGVYDKVAWMDDPMAYSDGVLLATPVGKFENGVLPTVGIDRTYRDANKAFNHGLRSGLSIVLQNSGAQAGVAVDGRVAYAFFPTCSGVVSGHIGSDGTLIEETGLAADAATPTGTGAVALSGFDARMGLLFACPASAAPLVVNTGCDSEGHAWLFPLTSYLDHTLASQTAPCSFVFIPQDMPGLTGGIYDGTTGEPLKSVGEATIDREATGTWLLRLPVDPGPATMLLNSLDAGSTGAYSDAADNVLTYEPLGGGTYRIHCYDLPLRTPEDTTFTWAVVPDDSAAAPTDLDEANSQLIAHVPDADMISDGWQFSREWGWMWGADWPWVWVDSVGWVFFSPAGSEGACWVYAMGTGEWLGFTTETWPWLYSPTRGWVDSPRSN